MAVHKSLLSYLGEAIDRYRTEQVGRQSTPQATVKPPRRALTWLGRQLMPNLGSVLLVLVMLTVFPGLAAPFNSINATSISTIPYQGRLADASGNPVTGKQNMEFRIYNTPTSGAPLWEEFWTGGNSVDVSDGLFSVMLGSINTGLTAVVQGNHNLYLGITVGTDSEMVPRVQLGSVPFSIWSLTVADNSITSAKIVDGAVTADKIAVASINLAHIANDAAEPNRLENRTPDDVTFGAAGPPATRVTVDPGIVITVPPGKAYYYIVSYNGFMKYHMDERIVPSTGFFAYWSTQLVSGDTIISTNDSIVTTGYRQDWASVGGNWYWQFPYSATWLVRLEQGTHNLRIRITGYSDNTVNYAHIHEQRVQVLRVP